MTTQDSMRDELGAPEIVDRNSSYRLLDLTVYGRQEAWEDSPPGWPRSLEGKGRVRTNGRPIAQWPRLEAGYSDDLGTVSAARLPRDSATPR
jgi:hypothetical protein